MKTEQRELKRYIKQIYRKLPYTGKERRRIIGDLQNNVGAYLESNPEASVADVQAHFGSPEGIAYSCVEQTELDVLLRKMRIRKTVIRIVGAVALVVLLLWGGVVGWAFYNEWNNSRGYTIDTIDEIEE